MNRVVLSLFSIFVTSLTFGAASILISGKANLNGKSEIVVPSTEAFTFALTADPHVGRAATFGAGEPSNNYVHIQQTFSPQFMLVLGDVTDGSTADQTVYWSNTVGALSNSASPIWSLAGNHDECLQCPYVYSNYMTLFTAEMHWVRDYGSFRFIGFDSRFKYDEPFINFGRVEDSEYTWLTNEIEVARVLGKKTILCTHFPLLDTFGNNIKIHQTEIINAMSNAGNVVMYLGGHRHAWGRHVTNAGTVHVDCPGVSYSSSGLDSPYSVEGGFFIVTVTNRELRFRLYACDEPTYTMRDTNFAIPY